MSTPSKDISAYAAGPLLFTGLVGVFMVPYEIAALIDGWGLSAATAGLLGMVELAAMSLSSMIMPAARRIPLHRMAVVGLAVAVAGEASTFFISEIGALVSARVLTGIGSGMVLAATSTSVAVATNPNRVMGLGLTIANLLFFAVFLFTPRVLLSLGPRGIFISVALYVAVSAVAVPHLSRLPAGAPPLEDERGRTVLDKTKVAALAVGLLSLNIGLGAMWSFAERIGREIGLSSQQTGSVLAACSIAMIAGSATAGLMGNRFGDRRPLLLGCIVCGIACYGTTISTGLTSYAAGLVIFNFCYLLIGPFALAGVPSTLDPSGRLAAAANGLMWLAYSAGVAAGGFIADRASVKVIGVFAFCGCVVAAGTFACAARPRQELGTHADKRTPPRTA
jgi:predicted MFS family arabinose efflux permease